MKKLLGAVIALVFSLLLVLPLAACGGGTAYSVTVTSNGGSGLYKVTASLYDGDSLVGSAATDTSGIATIKAQAGEYTVSLSNLPNGYDEPTGTYTVTEEEPSVQIDLSSHVIDGTVATGYFYHIGDVMYDFTVTTSDGDTWTLSEQLESKKMVLINFWYSWCGPCYYEMPYLESAYQNYKDEVSVIALSPYDSNPTIAEYKSDNNLTFDMAYQSQSELCTNFQISGFPTSIVIDRYGLYAYATTGSASSAAEFEAIFEKYCADGYVPGFTNKGDEGDTETEREKPNIEMEDSSVIEAAINGTNADGSAFDGTYTPETGDDAEYSWPFVTGSSDGTGYIYASNKNVQNYSYATIYVTFTAKAGDVFAFDLKYSVESGYDYLYVIIDNSIVGLYTGVSNGWETCYGYVPVSDGTYTVAFLYYKDEADPGDSICTDDVWITNLRLTTEDEMLENGASLDVRYNCSTDLKEDGSSYNSYVSVGLNEDDGYYHLLDENGEPNGPYVLADMLNGNTHWSEYSVYYYAYYGLCVFDGVDYTDTLTTYSSVASNSDIYGYVPVTQELYEILVLMAENLGGDGHVTYSDEWLEICSYYLHYGTGTGIADSDPTLGLWTYTAIPLTENTEENPYTNTINITKQLYPRGLYHVFTPSEDGVYEFATSGNNEQIGTMGMVLDADLNVISNEENEDGGYYTFYAYLEAGQTYYVLLDTADNGDTGTFYLTVTNVGSTYSVLRNVTHGFYTYDEDYYDRYGSYLTTISLIAPGIDINPQDYYVVVDGDTEMGYVYVDLLGTTYLSGSASVQDMLEGTVYYYVYDEYGNNIENKNYDPDSTDPLYKYPYQVAIVTFTEEETAILQKYIAMAEADQAEGDTGLVAVTEELAEVLEALAHKVSNMRTGSDGNQYITNEWLMMCYYYHVYGITE